MELGNFRIDGGEATRRVKQYFLDVHGQFGMMGFRVLEVKHDEQQLQWVVRCAFYPGPTLFEFEYEVRVSDSGDILAVSKMEPPGPLPGELPRPG